MTSMESINDYTSLGCLLSAADNNQPPAGRLVYLVRHGEIQDAHLGRCIGRMDIPLSKTGHIQAHQAGKWLAKQNVSISLWSSPLTRCMETAKAIQEETGCGVIHIENALVEMDAGLWDGMTFAEIKEKYPEEYEARGKNLIRYQTPEGESFFDAGARFLDAIQKILRTSESGSAAEVSGSATEVSGSIQDPLVIVAHSGVIRSALCHLGAWSFDYMLCIPQPNAGVTIIQAKKNRDDSYQITPTLQIGIPTFTS